MLETIEAWIGFILVLVFLGTLFAGFSMWYGAGLGRIDRSGFWKSLFVAFCASGVTYLITLAALVFSPSIRTLHGFAAGLVLSVFVIKGIYRTSLLKALVPWVFFLAAQGLAILAAAELVIGSLPDLHIMIR